MSARLWCEFGTIFVLRTNCDTMSMSIKILLFDHSVMTKEEQNKTESEARNGIIGGPTKTGKL